MFTSCVRRIGQCDFWVVAERMVPPLFHPCAPRENPGVEQGVVPRRIDVMETVARIHDLEAIVWRGDVLFPTVEQNVRIWGTPLGHLEMVRVQLASLSVEHVQLLGDGPAKTPLQCHVASCTP